MADANELDLLVGFAQNYMAGRRAGFTETANDSRDAERLIERLAKYKATPLPADAALADAVALLRRTYQNHWPSTEIKAFLAKIDAMPDAALRALSQPEVAEVPEGFVLVPIEPTEAMIIAGDGWSITKRGELRTVYRAMLSAARLPREVRDERQHSSWRQGANRCLCSR